MPEKDFVTVDRDWTMEEIDPQAIAHALRGEFTESHDADSLWHISMYYGLSKKEHPVYVLKLHPEKRKVLIDIPGPRWREHRTYYTYMKLRDVYDVEFVEWTNPETKQIETDIIFSGTTPSGTRASTIHVSSTLFHVGGEEE